MLYTLTLLFAFQFLGEFLHRNLSVPIPGPVLGMVSLLAFLLIKGKVSESFSENSKQLLQHLPLFFIPAGVGLMLYPDILARQGLAIGASLILGTVVAFVLTAVLIQALMRRKQQDRHSD